MMRFVVILFFVLFHTAYGQVINASDGNYFIGPDKNIWNAFEGLMDGKHFEVSLYIFNDGSIQGYYFDSLCFNSLFVKGSMDGNTISLNVYKDTSAVGFFSGSIIKRKSMIEPSFTDKIWQGAWYKGDKSKPFEAKFMGEYGDGSAKGDFSSYGYYGDYSTLISYERQLKKALLKRDKKWLTDHTAYPLTVIINNQVSTIKDKNDFSKRFDLIFTNGYMKKVIEWCPYIYGVNGHGIAIDNVWIRMCDNVTETNYEYCVFSFE